MMRMLKELICKIVRGDFLEKITLLKDAATRQVVDTVCQRFPPKTLCAVKISEMPEKR